MRILIVEDDQNKARQLASFIRHRWPDCLIIEKKSYRSGLAEIVSGIYDLILLDMSMPTYDISPHEPGGRPRIFAGKEILRQMQRRGITTSVLVVTQFESFGEKNNLISLNELREELQKTFLPNYVGTVYYNAAHDNWREELARQINVAKEKTP